MAAEEPEAGYQEQKRGPCAGHLDQSLGSGKDKGWVKTVLQESKT